MAPDVTITIKTIDQSSAVVKKVNQEFKSLAPGLEKATGGIGKFVSANAGLLSVVGGVAAGLAMAGKALYSSALAYEHSAKMGAKLEAVIRSTGGAAGQTVAEMNALASSLSKITGVDDELIVSAEAVLLTFTKIGDSAFQPAMEAAMNLSAVMGGDLQGAVVQVGKAMNDFSGYTALKRAGVSFTEEQIKQIEGFKQTNDLVGYQKLLLDELGVEFGGAAAAMHEAGLETDTLKNSWGNLVEAIGRANAGWVEDFNRGLSYTFDSFNAWITQMTNAANSTEEMGHAYTSMRTAAGLSGKAVVATGSSFERFSKQMERGTAMTEFYTTGQYAASVANEELGISLEELSSHNADLINDAISIQASQDEYNETQDETLAKIAELQAEKEAMYGGEEDDIAAVDEKIRDLQGAYDESAAAFVEAQQTKLTMMALEKIALSDGVAGYSEAEAEKAKAILATAGIAEEAAIREAIAFDEATTAIANGLTTAQEFADLLDLMSKGYSIDVAVNIQQHGNIGGAGMSDVQGDVGNEGESLNLSNKASGGQLSSGWNLVGDTQSGQFVPGLSELIHNGRVYSSAESEELINSGKVKVAKSYAFGDDEHIANLGGGSSKTDVSNRAGGLGVRLGGDGASFDSQSPATIASDIAAQVSVQTNIAMQTYTSNMTAAFSGMNDKLDDLISAVKDTPRANGRFVGDAIIRAQV